MAQGIDLLLECGTTSTTSSTRTAGTTSLIDDKNQTDDVINLYRELTGNKFTDADRTALSEVASIPPERIQIGIAMSVARSKNRIRSFRYCLGAIQEVAEVPIGDLQQYLSYVKSKARKRRASNGQS